MKILVIESDELVRNTVKKLLESRGHKVITAAFGEEGLLEFEKNSDCDLVISDMIMDTRITGIDVFRSIRARNEDIELCIYTGDLSDDLKKKASLLRAKALWKGTEFDELCKELGI